jgi:hypothetical protein
MCQSRDLASAVTWARACLIRLARDRFRCAQDRLDGAELGGVEREPEDGQPVPGGDQCDGSLGSHSRAEAVAAHRLT